MARKRRHKRGRRVTARQDVAQQQATTRARRARAWRQMAFLGALLALAIALRAASLTKQSLWADEGNSVRLAERSLDLVVSAARADIHPPGYYVLLWVWVRLFGQGELAVRALSVVIGVALVGVVYLMGSRWFGARSGWLAAFCAAVSPFQVAYSQEVRMYILTALLGAVTTYAFGQWIVVQKRQSRWAWGAAYVLAAAGGLWTHYSFPVILLALNVAWLAWWLGSRGARRREGRPALGKLLAWWLGLQLMVMALYAPWLPTAWSKTWGYGAISARHSVSFVAGQAVKVLSVGETVPDDDITRWLTVGIVGLSVFGAWSGLATGVPSGKRLTPVRTLALILVVVMPIGMMVGLLLTGRSAFRPKFFLAASPAFSLLAGQGIATLERPTAGKRTMASRAWLLLGLGIVGVGAARSLREYYASPEYARADYRGIAQWIAESEREGDAILLNAPNQWEVFTYYYQGETPVYPLCRTRPPQEEGVTAELEEIATAHQRLFAVYWATDESDPERIVERWLERHAFKALDKWYGDVRLVVYATQEVGGEPSDALRPAQPLADVRLGEEIALRGYTLSPDDIQRGDVLRVSLFWEALSRPGGRYKVFLHLVDASGTVVSQHDGEPGDGMDPTTGWDPARGVFADRYGVLVPQAVIDGTYRLVAGMYDISGSPRLPVTVEGKEAGESLTLAKVEID